jgi:uncharacterized membrane protein YqiK
MPVDNPFHLLFSFWWVVAIVLVIACYRLILRLFGVVLIPQSSVGIVDKRYAVLGKSRTLAAGQIVALNGEAGVQADTLAPGLHFFLWPGNTRSSCKTSWLSRRIPLAWSKRAAAFL